MTTPYEIQITLSGPDINTLKNEGWSLFAFKSVKTTAGGAEPVLWFKTQTFMQTTKVDWTESYQAYVSTSAIVPNGSIDAETDLAVNLGQTITVDKNGNLSAASSGEDGVVTLSNPVSGGQWTSGLSQEADGVFVPMCALTLHGMTEELIAPIEKVLLMFATAKFNTGQVIYQSFSQGLMVDLTSAPTVDGVKSRSVGYVLNDGWNWNDATWAQPTPAKALLGDLLIEQDSSLAHTARQRRHMIAA